MWEQLRVAEGDHALAAAQDLVDRGVAGRDPLSAVTTLREAGFSAELASAAITQAGLRTRALVKFGPDALRMYFTRDGWEQATRGVVARRRADRLVAAGVSDVVDLCCGIGADAIAFARAGLRVLAVDADPTTAAMAAANVSALGLDDLVTVRCQDATEVDLSDVDAPAGAVFCDPARRRRGGGRVFDPDAYSPPWSFVAELPTRVPATVLKLAPGIDHALLSPSSGHRSSVRHALPAGAEAEWVSVDGDVVEAAIWAGPLAQAPRRATVVRGDDVHQLTGTGDDIAPVGPLRSYVYDPDGAVVRSHLVAEFAAAISGNLADEHIAYVFADTPPDPGTAAAALGRCFAIQEELPFAVKKLRPALRSRGIGRLEILKRGVAVEPDQLRKQLQLAGPGSASLILLRAGDAHRALLCQPVIAGG